MFLHMRKNKHMRHLHHRQKGIATAEDILHSLAVSVAQVDRHGHYLTVNRHWLHMLRTNDHQIQYASIQQSLDADPEGLRWADLTRLAVGGTGTLQIQHRMVRNDGSIFWGLLSLSPLPKAGGSDPTFLVVVFEITEQVETEQNLRRRLRELNSLRIAMSDLANHLELDDLLPVVLHHAVCLLNASHGEISLYEGQPATLRLATQINMGNDYRGLAAVLPAEALEPLLASPEPLIRTSIGTLFGVPLLANAVLVPLLHQEKRLGMLTVGLAGSQPSPSASEFALLRMFAQQAAMAIENALLFAEVQRLTITDPLMGIANRRHFLLLAEQLYEQAHQYHTPFAVLMMDIDHFKRINDQHGHQVGDQVLQRLAYACQQRLRNEDLFGRYGGEELIMLLPHTTAAEAQAVAERLRVAISGLPIETDVGILTITVSIGVASLPTPNRTSLGHLIHTADVALYLAKQQGRNRVMVAESGSRIPPPCACGSGC